MATISKRGNSYRIRVSDGYDVNGKQKMRSMTWTPDPGMTPRQIEKELNRQAVLFEESRNMTANVKFQTFSEQWFAERVEGKLKETTREKYRRLTGRVYKAVGHLRLDKITRRHIQLFINNLEEDGINQVTKQKLSSKSVRDYLSFVSSVFNYAIELDLIHENPCRHVKVSADKAATKSSPDEKCYSLEEAQRFLELLEHEAPLRKAFFMAAIYGGFRKGELLGLEWPDIDFDTGVITIRREAEYTTAKGHYTDTPKTRTSIRSVRLPEVVLDAFRERKIEQGRDRLMVGDRWQDTQRIFTNREGYQLGSASMYSWLMRFCDKNGLRKVSIHSFRHLNATLLISNGVDVKTISSLLGHSQTSTTLNIYAHALADAQARASQAIADVLALKKAP